MDIQFQCSNCQTWLKVDASLQGQAVSCWQCQTPQVAIQKANMHPQVTASPVHPPASFNQPFKTQTRLKSPKAGQSGIGWLKWVIAGSVVGLLFLGALIAWLLLAPRTVRTVVDGNSNDPFEQRLEQFSEDSNDDSSSEPSPAAEKPKRPNLRGPGNRAAKKPQDSTSTSSRTDARSSVSPQDSDRSSPAIAKKPQEKQQSTESPEWGNEKANGDPKADTPNWGGAGARFAVTVKSDRDLVLGPLGCPVVIVKNEVWHLEKNTVVATLNTEYEGNRPKALSHNGQRFVAFEANKKSDEASVLTFDTVSGKLLAKIPVDPEHKPKDVSISRDNFAVLSFDAKKEVKPHFKVYNATTGELTSTIPTQGRRMSQATFTNDGKYFTGLVDDRMVVMSSKGAKIVANLESPKIIDNDLNSLNKIQKSIRAKQIFSQIKVIKFSPDSSELVAVTDSGKDRMPRLLCWDKSGLLIQDSTLPQISHRFFFDQELNWFPDKSAWIVSGGVFDRKSSRLVMSIQSKFGDDPLFRPLDRNRLLGRFAHEPEILQIIDIPWDKINQSLELMESSAQAVLSPNQPVGLTFELKKGRNTAGTEKLLREGFVNRLADEGIEIAADNKTTRFNLRLTEKAGEQLPIYEKNSPFDFRGRDTGRRATETKGELAVELIHNDKVVWRDFLKSGSSRSFEGPINDATVRQSMMEKLSRSLDELALPYFIPKSKEHHSLPVYVR